MFIWKYLSREQALEFRDHVRAREPFRLQMLARLLRDTGGPIEEMDASFASLVPLWGWMVTFVDAGCPGVDPRLVPSMWVDGVDGRPDTHRDRARAEVRRPTEVVGEAIDHYARLVWDRLEPPTVWDIFTCPPRQRELDHLHHLTGLSRPSGWRTCHYGRGRASLLLNPDATWSRDPGSLLRQFVSEEGWSQPPDQERGPSVLVPYLDVDLGPIPEGAAVSPVWLWPQVGPSERPGPPPADAEPMILWRGSYEDLDEPARLGVLDVAKLVGALREAGFIGPDGVVLDAVHLTGGVGRGGEVGVDLGHRSEAALAQVLVLNGAVRSLRVEPFGADRKAWSVITRVLRALAKAENARLIKESHMQ